MSQARIEAIKKAIEDNSKEVLPSIFAHAGMAVLYTDDAGPHETRSAKVVLGLPGDSVVGSLKNHVAKAREIGLNQLKMFAADVLVVDSDFRKNNWRDFKGLSQKDGRILGMTMRLAKPGALPLGAIFMIADSGESGPDEGAKTVEPDEGIKSALLDAMIKALKDDSKGEKKELADAFERIRDIYSTLGDRGGGYY